MEYRTSDSPYSLRFSIFSVHSTSATHQTDAKMQPSPLATLLNMIAQMKSGSKHQSQLQLAVVSPLREQDLIAKE